MSRPIPLTVASDRVQVTGPAKVGDPANSPRVVLSGEGPCAEWRTVLLSTTAPVEVFLEWNVGTSDTSARLVAAAGATISLFAKTLRVKVGARTSGDAIAKAVVYDGRTDTANVWSEWVTGDAGGARFEVEVPPYAQTVRLEPGNVSSSGELTLVDPYGNARAQRAGPPGAPVEAVLGACRRVFVHLPAGEPGRLVYTLPF